MAIERQDLYDILIEAVRKLNERDNKSNAINDESFVWSICHRTGSVSLVCVYCNTIKGQSYTAHEVSVYFHDLNNRDHFMEIDVFKNMINDGLTSLSDVIDRNLLLDGARRSQWQRARKLCCPLCRGTGVTGDATCAVCGGDGITPAAPRCCNCQRNVVDDEGDVCQSCSATGRMHADQID